VVSNFENLLDKGKLKKQRSQGEPRVLFRIGWETSKFKKELERGAEILLWRRIQGHKCPSCKKDSLYQHKIYPLEFICSNCFSFFKLTQLPEEEILYGQLF